MTNMFDDNTQTDDDAEVMAIRDKYKDDPDEMIKALVHSQKHIKTIESENAEYKTKVAQATTLDTVLERLKTSNVTPPKDPATTGTTPSVLDDNTLQQKIEETLRKRSEQERQEASKQLVRETLLTTFKTPEKAKEEMFGKAKELNMSIEELDNLAIKSPAAFFRLFGIDGKPQIVNTAPTKGSVRTNALSANTTEKNEAYYSELLKTDRSKYFSQEIQNEIMALAMKKAGIK